MITRHSSRRSPLDTNVLRARLIGASSYDRIAGYFRSSLFEIAGEELEVISGPIRIICNSDLDARDRSEERRGGKEGRCRLATYQ